MSEPAISCTGLTKTFLVPDQEQTTLRSRLLHPWQRTRHRRLDALEDVSFDVRQGEFFGVVGRNGSGKSTLLKILAGIYRPNGGDVAIRGSLAPFIELGVGFNDELSARDNVLVNGSILGMSRRDLEDRYPDIVEFAELEGFMDAKLRNFSSGMLMRLAFAIAVQSDADILLVDEVLAVGDERFQRKCQDVFRERRRRGQTVVFVSHDMTAVESFCDRALVLDRGRVAALGAATEVVPTYHRLNRDDKTKRPAVELRRANESHQRKSFLELSWSDGSGASEIADLGGDQPLELRASARVAAHLGSPKIRLLLHNEGGGVVGELEHPLDAGTDGNVAPVDITIANVLTTGRYLIVAELHAAMEDGTHVLADSGTLEFDVYGSPGIGSTRFQSSVTPAEAHAT